MDVKDKGKDSNNQSRALPPLMQIALDQKNAR
jgi:hypothetical protein